MCTWKFSWFMTFNKSCFHNLPGVSEKSDEFKSCIFRVVLGIECRIGYQVKAYSKIFCLSEDPPHLTEARWAHIRDDPSLGTPFGPLSPIQPEIYKL